MQIALSKDSVAQENEHNTKVWVFLKQGDVCPS